MNIADMDARKGGTGARGRGGTGARAPPFSKIRKKCPFSLSLVALLESFEDAKTLAKYTLSAISEYLSFKISRGAYPWTS